MKSEKKTTTPAQFVHLHNHTHYSLLDGLQKIEPMLDKAKEMGMTALAITDHGTLSGAVDFYKAAQSRSIKPLIGIETYIASRSLTDKEAAKDKTNYHLTVLAMNTTGYKNLMRLSTIANLEGFYYRPRIDHATLEKYNDGLIVLSGCIGGEVSDALRQGQYKQAKKAAEWYKQLFGDRYYLELQDHGHPDHPTVWNEQTRVNEQLLKLSKELAIKTVVTCDAHYLNREDQEAHEILLCVQTGSFLDEDNRMSLKEFQLHLTDPREITRRWGKEHMSSLSNTVEVAERCDVSLELGNILIPKFPLKKGQSEQQVLEENVYRGLAWRYGGVHEQKAARLTVEAAKASLPKHVSERAAYELQVIDQMGFNGYFLIIADFIGWGKSQGIVFGPGRGSAAGSIISYALKITELDPLEYDLLFERFLNPDRISMPDIDIDIQDTRRDEVIQYCIDKYGKDRVANIVTFGKMAARNAVRDVARVLRVPYAEADRLAKMIPPPVQGRHIPLAVSLKENKELQHENESNSQSARVFDLATRLEGTIRSHGVHAAGVVIAPSDIVNFTPLEVAQKGVIATQYSMGPIEELGLLKMDFLGLSNLTIIKNTLRIVKKVYGKSIDINAIPLNDPTTFSLLQRGETTGVFQLESAGMKRYLKELKPTEFDDIIAMCALYRPGPLSAGLVDTFIKRKNGEETVHYDHPTMQPALEATYGVLVYQEQFMQISKDVCGFSGGEADTLRKAIGKKKRDVMVKMETRFIEGAVERGIDRSLIEAFWKKLLGFADYCFNKSHSACYAMIAYQTAYLKAHYPDAFMAALMTSDYDDIDRLTIEITECKAMEITVLPPDINESYLEFAIVPGENKIRFGMQAIKNVGTHAVEEILRTRDLQGPFVSLEDFFSRVQVGIVKRKTIESLIKAGAFDRFGTRGHLLHNIDAMHSFATKKQKERISGQTDLFGNDGESATSTGPQLVLTNGDGGYTTQDYLLWERELLGLYLSQHPLEQYRSLLEEITMPMQDITPDLEGKRVVVGGTVLQSRTITTKNGQNMAFVNLAGFDKDLELLLFPSILQQTIDIWQNDMVVIVKGKVSTRDRDGRPTSEVKIIVEEARPITLEQAKAYQPTGKKKSLPKRKTNENPSGAPYKPGRLYIRMTSTSDTKLLHRLKDIIDQAKPGNGEVVLITGTATKQAIRLPNRVMVTKELEEQLSAIFGADNVKQ